MKDYWPGGSGHWATSPSYPDRVRIVDTTGYTGAWSQNVQRACMMWNACGAGIILMIPPFRDGATEPGTITIMKDPHGPYGGYNEDLGYGYVAMVRGDGDVPSIAHELGHALGFGHTGSSRSIMSQWNSWPRRSVGRIDKKGLRHYYGRR